MLAQRIEVNHMAFNNGHVLADPAAEANVLAAMFSYGRDAYLDHIDIVRNTTFTDPVNQAVFNVCKAGFDDMDMENIDPATFMSLAKSNGADWIYDKPEEPENLFAHSSVLRLPAVNIREGG